jgi:hypothetical protein
VLNTQMHRAVVWRSHCVEKVELARVGGHLRGDASRCNRRRRVRPCFDPEEVGTNAGILRGEQPVIRELTVSLRFAGK